MWVYLFCQSVNETLVNIEMKAIVKGGGCGECSILGVSTYVVWS